MVMVLMSIDRYDKGLIDTVPIGKLLSKSGKNLDSKLFEILLFYYLSYTQYIHLHSHPGTHLGIFEGKGGF